MAVFFRRDRVQRTAAKRLYDVCLTAARRPALFVHYGIPDTMEGRFEALTLHLFPVLHRLMRDPGDDPELATLISESFVADMDSALREMGVGDVAVPKRMTKLYRSFGGRMTAYADAQADPTVLADAIARNVFADDDRDGASKARALAAVVGAAVESLRRAGLADLRAGRLVFPDLPRAGAEEAVP